MAIFRDRLPPRHSVVPVFAVIVFLVFSWCLVWFFHKVPSWELFLGIWDILGILSYALGFALLESLLVLGIVVALGAILPASALRARFPALGSTLVLVTTFWTILFQLVFVPIILYWSGIDFVLWFGLAFVSVVLTLFLVHRSERAQEAVAALADRITVFVYLYVPLGLLGLLVVVARNIL